MAARKLLGKRLGRSVANEPKTLTLDEVLDEPVVEDPAVLHADSEGLIVDPVVEAAHKSQWEEESKWIQLRANKGWTEQGQIRMLTDFIRARGLFQDLTSFAAKRSRK